MDNNRATIVNRDQRRKEILVWIVAFMFFVIFVMPATFWYLSKQSFVAGAILSLLFLPISSIVYPFIMIIGKLGNSIIIFLNFGIVILNFVLLFNAWNFTNEGRSIFHRIPKHSTPLHPLSDRLKHFYGWIWLTWASYLGYFILYILSPVYVLFGPVREMVFIVSLKSKVWAKDHPTFFAGIIFMFYLQILVAIPSLTYQLLGKEHLFEGIFGAVAVIAFIAFQFQNITPAYFVSTFLDSTDTSTTNGKFKTVAKPSTPIWLLIGVTNLGITTFKDCSFQVTFPQGFSVLGDFDLYKAKDFAKFFTLRSNKTTVEFLPQENYMTFSPCTSLVFPICVLTPGNISEYQITCSLSSESSWGVHTQPLAIAIENIPVTNS